MYGACDKHGINELEQRPLTIRKEGQIAVGDFFFVQILPPKKVKVHNKKYHFVPTNAKLNVH